MFVVSLNEIFKDATQKIVTYLDKPKEERIALKQARKDEKPLLLNQMFGTVPLALMLLFKKKQNK